MRILILGGTQFFGRRLVHLLLHDGHEVTVATRGRTVDDFGDRVRRIQVDRADPVQMQATFRDARYDVVYDEICFNPRDAKVACDALGDCVGRYVLTSSMAVYGHKDAETTEGDIDLSGYAYDITAPDYPDAEGKRQAEAFFVQQAPFPVVAVRVALGVSGDDDVTGRFDYYVQHIAESQSIGVLETEHPITYVTAWDVADFLRFIGTQSDYQGPINAANGGYLSVQALSAAIGRELGVAPRFHDGVLGSHDKPLPPYVMAPATWKISNARARSLGYEFPAFRSALPVMVRQAAVRLGLRSTPGNRDTMPGIRVARFGVFVPNLARAVQFYHQLGFRLDREIELPPLSLAFVTLGHTVLELIETADPVPFHHDGVLNHMTLAVDDLDQAVERGIAAGATMLVPPMPLGAGRAAFLQGVDGEVLELFPE